MGSVLIWILLVSVLVIGVIYGREALCGRIVLAAEARPSVDAEVVGISDPTEHIEYGRASTDIQPLVHQRLLTAKGPRHRLSGRKDFIHWSPYLPLIRAFHWQAAIFGVNPNSAIYLANVRVGSAGIGDIKLSQAHRAVLNPRWGVKCPADWGQWSKKETSRDYPWALGENQSFFRGSSLPLHDISLASDGLQGPGGDNDAPDSNCEQGPIRDQRRQNPFAPARLIRFAIGTLLFFCGAWPSNRDRPFRGRFWKLAGSAFSVALIGVGLICLFWDRLVEADGQHPDNQPCSQVENTVTRRVVEP